MAKVTLDDLANLENEATTVSTVNNNNALIEAALENTLSRDGTSPNTMGANLDMNSNRILNLPAPVNATEPLRLGDIDPDNIQTQVAEAAASAAAALASETAAAASESAAEAAQTAAEAAQTAAEAVADKLEGTSTSSVSIGTGTKSFTTQSGKFFDVGNWLIITSDASPTTHYMTGQVTGYTGTALQIESIKAAGSGSRADWTIRVSGTIGETGSTGDTGLTGPAGADGVTINNGLDYNWDTGTTDADPGSGKLRVNNATLGSATFIYVNKTGRNSESYGAFIGSFDDSTTTANKGTLIISTVADPTEYLIATITGTLTDATTYWKIPVSVVSSNGAPANTDRMSFRFYRTGDAGAGTGDVVGPASATNNGYVRFDGTTGKLIKNGAATVPVADIDIAGATEVTSGEAADIIPVYDASATANRRVTFSNLMKAITGLTAETAPATNDELIINDVSASTADKITLQNMLKVLNGLTEDTTPDTAADFLLAYDTSASDVKKVKLNAVGGSGGTAPTRQQFTASGTWTKPTGCRFIKVTCVGGGGAGGAATAAASQVAVGFSGSGGAGTIEWIDATSLTSETVTVGSGGTGGSGNGGNGGTSSFGAHCSAGGGTGGTANWISSGTSAGAWSLYGVAQATATGGDVNRNGCSPNGVTSRTSSSSGSSGGGADGPFGIGCGGAPVGPGVAGIDGTGYGSGGSAGCSNSATTRNGGSGAPGIVIVEELY